MARDKRVQKSKKNKGAVIAIVTAVSVVALCFAAFMFLGVYVSSRNTIFPNIYVSDIEVGGMTYDSAHSKLLNSELGISGGVKAEVVLTDAVTLTVTTADAGLSTSITSVTDAAYNFGRDGGFFKNAITFIKCLTASRDVLEESVFDEQNVRSMIADAAAKVEKGSIESGYTVSDKEIVVQKGASGYTVDQEGVYKFVHETILGGLSKKSIDFSEDAVKSAGSDSIDFDAIYEEIFVEPKNSEYDPETFSATDHVNGVSFDVEAAKARYEAAQPGDKIEILITVTEPEITYDELKNSLFRDKLGEKMTTMYTSSSNRINNITLAAKAINGTVLNPGEEFSFNGVVGERTAEKGYKPAGAYVGGESVDQIGGGICQASSTIYFVALKADLEITNRLNHMYSVAYLPLGFDATVNWGTIDFKFKNNREYPIKIVTYVQNKELFVEIWGTKVDDNYVELQYNLIETIPFNTLKRPDETIPTGTTQVKTSGHSGYIVEAFKLLYDGEGKLISKTFLSRDTYRKQDRVILIPLVIDPGTGMPVDPETGLILDPETGLPLEVQPEPVVPDPGTDPDPGTEPDPGVTPDPGTEPDAPVTGGETTEPDAPVSGGETTDPAPGTEPDPEPDPVDPAG